MANVSSNMGLHKDTDHVDVSIVTPSLNMLGYLKRCCASVADQRDVCLEHIIMDGGSTDQTMEWLRCRPSVISMSERDNGMYDAVNKGFLIARGGVIAHLNCDEQYLPDTLKYVVDYFQTHPDVDVLFGNVLTIRPDGSLIAYRKGYSPIAPVLLTSPMHVLTAAMFLRRRVVEQGQLYDASYKDIGDAQFVLRLLRAGYRVEHVPRYMSTFTLTGHNRSANVAAVSGEILRLFRQAPWWVRRFRMVWRFVGYGMKLMAGAYFEKMPIRYAIYGKNGAASRTYFESSRGSFRW